MNASRFRTSGGKPRWTRSITKGVRAKARSNTMGGMTGDLDKFAALTARAERGDHKAANDLLELVYTELRRVAGQMMRQERPGQTIGATALVHEAYIRLAESDHDAWADSRHFFNAAALAMRRCLIDRARRKGRVKHGGESARVEMDMVEIPASEVFELSDIEDVHDAIVALATHNPRWAEVVNLRVFLGLSIDQTAHALGVSPSTVKSDTRFSLAWIKANIDARRAAESEGDA